MLELSLESLRVKEPAKPESKYFGPTTYSGIELPPWNHPTSLALDILDEIEHTIFAGAQYIGPMGRGKTVCASVIAHHIHTLQPKFVVHWAEAEDFKHLQRYFEKLQKCQPALIIFDDITSALKEMSDKELAKNFNILTKIRHIVDPKKSKTPIIIFIISHYSKNVEKEFRSVLDRTVFLSFGNEERANIDAITPKQSQARAEINKFSSLYTKLYKKDKNGKAHFPLLFGDGRREYYETSKPFRPSCAVSGTNAKIIVFDEKDVCEKCKKSEIKRVVPVKEVFERIKKAHGPSGIRALKLALWRRGHYLALPRRVATASQFIEDRLLSNITFDFKEMIDYMYRDMRLRPPKQIYRKRRDEEEFMTDIEEFVEIKAEKPKEITKTD